jgi:hypothetical protein
MLIGNQQTATLNGISANITAMDAAGIGSGMAFLNGELEKRDTKLNEPLTSVTWDRDIVPKYGGGFSETTSNYFVDYATTGGNANGLIRGQSNDIPVIQANTTKDIFKTFLWSNILQIPLIDQQKLQSIGRSLDGLLDNGIRLNYNKSLDYMVYFGVPEESVYGLVNNPNVTATTVPNGASGTATWKTKTADEILLDINQILNDAWAAAQYDLSGMPNQILLPPAQFSYITTQKVSQAGNVSILTYLLENNIAKANGVDLVIVPCRQCIGAGLSGKDRMVAYVNDDSKLYIDILQELKRMMTQPDVQKMAYLTSYIANIGQVKFLYYQCVQYYDGI